MSPSLKLLTGLAAALILAWLHHGPLGNGARLVDGLEREAKAVVAAAGVPGVEVQMRRDPIARTAMLSGPANSFQRDGQGNQKGLTRLVGDVEGIAAVRWADEPAVMSMPLLVETLLQALLAYLLGIGAAWLIWGRARRESYI